MEAIEPYRAHCRRTLRYMTMLTLAVVAAPTIAHRAQLEAVIPTIGNEQMVVAVAHTREWICEIAYRVTTLTISVTHLSA